MTLSVLALWFLCVENDRVKKKPPAMTVSVLRELFSSLLTVQVLTVERIAKERNETLRRKETARIYAGHQKTNTYPPRRPGAKETSASGTQTPPPT